MFSLGSLMGTVSDGCETAQVGKGTVSHVLRTPKRSGQLMSVQKRPRKKRTRMLKVGLARIQNTLVHQKTQERNDKTIKPELTTVNRTQRTPKTIFLNREARYSSTGIFACRSKEQKKTITLKPGKTRGFFVKRGTSLSCFLGSSLNAA